MLYTGKTYDTAGRVVSVEIVTGNDRSRHIEIGAPESGLMLDSEEALTIEGETNDIFDVILRQSAIVRLKARDFVPDLFRSDCREATVVMKVGNNTVFDGFILPRTYSQGYNSVLDTLEVNCIDRLGALQWLTWLETMSAPAPPGTSGSFRSGRISHCSLPCRQFLTACPVIVLPEDEIREPFVL